MKRLVTDADKCTGCRACELACSLAHESVFSPALSRIRVVKPEHLGVDVPIVCRACARPSCVAACPTGALTRDNELARVIVDSEKCTGCRLCVDACPFGCIEMHPERKLPLVCDLCDGKPQCVRRCATGGVRYRVVRDDAGRKREQLALEEAEAVIRRWATNERPYRRPVKPEF